MINGDCLKEVARKFATPDACPQVLLEMKLRVDDELPTSQMSTDQSLSKNSRSSGLANPFARFIRN